MKLFTILKHRVYATGAFKNSSKIVSGGLVVFTFLISGITFAQTTTFSCSDPRRCTSKDLEVLDAFVEGADQCTSCPIGDSVDRTLYMTIVNKTGSVRTAFALFGTLNGGRILGQSGSKVFLCVGPINPKDTATFPAGTIRFKCTNRLTLTDNYLAWTDASGTKDARCAEFALATRCQDIAPKCGTAAEIVIRTALVASASTVTEPCIGATSGGSLKVMPTGGVRRYNIVVCKFGPASNTADCPTTPNSDSVVGTFTKVDSAIINSTLAAGKYCIYVTDSVGCTYKFSHTIIGKQCCTNPPKPCITATTAGICSDGYVTLTISNARTGDWYYFVQGAYKDSAQTTTGTIIFDSIVPSKTDFKVYGVESLNGTTCTSDTSRCDDLGKTCASATVNSRIQNQDITLDAPVDKTSVIAAPNPFNDRIRFTLKSAISGQGSLELYNTLGQKVKTVFQGYVEKGQVQTIEYAVPGAQRSNLIYVFRVGTESTSGKLIGLKQ